MAKQIALSLNAAEVLRLTDPGLYPEIERLTVTEKFVILTAPEWTLARIVLELETIGKDTGYSHRDRGVCSRAARRLHAQGI